MMTRSLSRWHSRSSAHAGQHKQRFNNQWSRWHSRSSARARQHKQRFNTTRGPSSADEIQYYYIITGPGGWPRTVGHDH